MSMKCLYCNKQIEDNTPICPRCYAALNKKIPKKVTTEKVETEISDKPYEEKENNNGF